MVITLASHAGNRGSSPRIGTNYFAFPLLLFSLSREVRYTIVLEEKNVRVCILHHPDFNPHPIDRMPLQPLAAGGWQYVRTRNNGKGVRNDRELYSSNRGISHLNEARRIDKLSRGSVLGLKFSQTTNDRNVP